MLNSKTEALGIIFPNSYDAMVPDLVSERLMASIPFASRYRMCDFILSSMVHSGIDNISIIVRKNYHSLLDHLGAGRENFRCIIPRPPLQSVIILVSVLKKSKRRCFM